MGRRIDYLDDPDAPEAAAAWAGAY